MYLESNLAVFSVSLNYYYCCCYCSFCLDTKCLAAGHSAWTYERGMGKQHLFWSNLEVPFFPLPPVLMSPSPPRVHCTHSTGPSVINLPLAFLSLEFTGLTHAQILSHPYLTPLTVYGLFFVIGFFPLFLYSHFNGVSGGMGNKQFTFLNWRVTTYFSYVSILKVLNPNPHTPLESHC